MTSYASQRGQSYEFLGNGESGGCTFSHFTFMLQLLFLLKFNFTYIPMNLLHVSCQRVIAVEGEVATIRWATSNDVITYKK